MTGIRTSALSILFVLILINALPGLHYSSLAYENNFQETGDEYNTQGRNLLSESEHYRIKSDTSNESVTPIFNIEQSKINILEVPDLTDTYVNGRFQVISINNLKISILVQLNTNTGSDAMGGATMVIGFDTTSIGFNSNPIKNVDYTFYGFCGENYSEATVTRPMSNCIWINIDLPFSNCNNGTLISGGNNWTDVVTINFDIVDPYGTANIYWITNSVFWGIYDDDNATIWMPGEYKDLSNTPLPVELSSFTAKLVDDEVNLKWITETEVNNYGFEVERKVNQDGWNKIGFVEGHGNSNSQKTYMYIDNHLFGGSKFYYRLKQIDTDGQYEYSDIIEIENIPQTFALFQNYPNPFNPLTKIRYQLPVTAKVEIKIFDLTGAEVVTILNEEKDAGVHEIEFNGQDGISTQGGYASGVYFYRLQATSSNHQTFVETKKMILIK